MNQIVSFFMSVVFAVMSLFGISYSAPDLELKESADAVVSEENLELFRYIFETETAFLASLQLENGAIPMTKGANGDLRMSPYFADITALALLDAGDRYAENVRAYADWHFVHLNTAESDISGLDGTIYDYTITMKGGKIAEEKVAEVDGKPNYDSTDSYAATFLSVLEKYYEKTGDTDYILAHSKEIERIANVMLATMHNGLTYASPGHKVKYLMDNCEVYEGALAAAELFEKVLCPSDEYFDEIRDNCYNMADKVKSAINGQLWNPVSKHYTPEMTNHGIPTKIFSWNMYYPCATAQLFPIICGVIEPNTERAEVLYGKFCDTYDWQSFDYPDDFYWGANVYAAALMNDIDSVVRYMTNYSVLMEKHSYPLYNADIARASMAAYVILERGCN